MKFLEAMALVLEENSIYTYRDDGEACGAGEMDGAEKEQEQKSVSQIII